MKNLSKFSKLVKEKGLLFLFFLVTVIGLCVFGTTDSKSTCKKAIVDGGADTCMVKAQNLWTGNYRLVDAKGVEFSAAPLSVLFVCSELNKN